MIHWPLDSLEPSREVPTAGPRRTWSCACRSQGQVLRLAGKWHKMGQQMTWKPQLLMRLHESLHKSLLDLNALFNFIIL